MFDQPFVRPSPMQSIDPRVRVALAFLCALCLAPLHDFTACTLGMVLGLVLLVMAKAPPAALLKRLCAVNVFILFLWCITPWTTPGQVVAQWGMFRFTAEGVELSLLVTLKSNAIVLIFLAMVATLETPATGHALEQLHCPHKLAFLFLFTERYIHVLNEEWHGLTVAATLRGFRIRWDLHTGRTIGSMLGLLLVRSNARAQRVREAMLLRGFNGHFHSVVTFRTRPADYVFTAFVAGALALILFTEIKGGWHGWHF